MTARAACLAGVACLTAMSTLATAALAAADPPRLLFGPDLPTDSDVVRVTLLGSETVTCGAYVTAEVDGAARQVHLRAFGGGQAPCPRPWWTSQVPIGFLTPGIWQVDATLDGQPYANVQLTVQASPTTVAIGSYEYFGTNFRIQVQFRDPRNGEVRLAPGAALSAQAAQFWFFDPANPELTVKILDGTSVNGHHWLFASTLTNLEVTLRVTTCVEGDPPGCAPPREYHVAAGSGLDVIDLSFD